MSVTILSAGVYDESTVQIDSVSQVQETCDLSNGSLTVHVSGSTIGLEYSIDGGATWQPSNFFPGLPDDDYLVLVRDIFSCSDVFTAQISDALDPEVELEVNCVPGRNLSNIVPVVLNGTPQYQFTWEGNGLSSTDEVFADVPPGFYSVTVTDRLGCTISDTITVQACCELNVQCGIPLIEIDCPGDLPAIDSTLLLPETQEQELVSGLEEIGVVLRPDFCQVLKVSVQEERNSPTSCTDGALIINRTYAISDDFFSYDCMQEIRVLRPIAPTISNEAQDLTADCGGDLDTQFQDWLDGNASLVLEGCSEPYTFSTDPEIPFPPASCNEPVDITFIVKDDCDNEFRSMATFIMEDNGAPEITCPDPLSIDPINDQVDDKISDWLDTATATDDCASTSPSHDFFPGTLSADCEQSQEIEVTFDAIDACDNVSTCIATISVQGLPAPVLNCGPDLILSCSDDREQAFEDWVAVFNAVDGNGLEIDVTNDLDPLVLADLDCNEDLGVLFSIIDDCDRPLDCLRILSIVDEEDPELTCPAALEVMSSDADAQDMISVWVESYTALDNCDPALDVEHDFSPVADLCAVTEDIEVIYTVEDACGNSATCTSSLSVASSSATISCPASLTFECGEGTEQDVIEWMDQVEVLESDGSSITPINDFTGIDDFIGCSEPLEITFSASSVCGGDVQCIGIIEIVDTTPPSINCPGQLAIDLIVTSNVDQRIEDWVAGATASDCNVVELSSSDLTLDSESLSCGGEQTVVFTAVDACGLTSTCESNLVLTNEATLTIECPEPVVLFCSQPRLDLAIEEHLVQVIVAGDNDFEVITEMDAESLGQDCQNISNVEIEVFAIDICGQEVSCTTEIQLQPDPQIYIPNIISPDGDGVNDFFNVFGNTSIDYVSTMIIYNRWGDKVFQIEDIPVNDEQAGWDGRFNQAEQGSQVFTYYVEIIDTGGATITKAGSIQVLK